MRRRAGGAPGCACWYSARQPAGRSGGALEDEATDCVDISPRPDHRPTLRGAAEAPAGKVLWHDPFITLLDRGRQLHIFQAWLPPLQSCNVPNTLRCVSPFDLMSNWRIAREPPG
jgi:hypothetical protein